MTANCSISIKRHYWPPESDCLVDTLFVYVDGVPRKFMRVTAFHTQEALIGGLRALADELEHADRDERTE